MRSPASVRVVDKLALLSPNPIAQVQATGPLRPGRRPPDPRPRRPGRESAPPPPREPLPNPNPAADVIPEPVPTFAAAVPSPYDLNPPRMPPYAWPTYAPYNNLSRVAYPVLPLPGLAVHRPVLPVPEDSAGLALGQAGVGGRPLVVQPRGDEKRLLAVASGN